MTNVVGLNGVALPEIETRAKGEVVELLEDALAAAKRGEVVALGLILVSPTLRISPWWANPNGDAHAIVAGCEYLKLSIHKLLAGEANER